MSFFESPEGVHSPYWPSVAHHEVSFTKHSPPSLSLLRQDDPFPLDLTNRTQRPARGRDLFRHCIFT